MRGRDAENDEGKRQQMEACLLLFTLQNYAKHLAGVVTSATSTNSWGHVEGRVYFGVIQTVNSRKFKE
jgi:hypothetical protein